MRRWTSDISPLPWRSMRPAISSSNSTMRTTRGEVLDTPDQVIDRYRRRA